MARDRSGKDPSGALRDSQDQPDSETTERRLSRASRAPQRTSKARFLRSRTTYTGELPAIQEEILETPPANPPVPTEEPADGPTTTVDADAEETPDEEATAADNRHLYRRRWILLTAFLAVTVLSLIGVAYYLTDVVEQWQVRADELSEANYQLGDQVAAQADAITAQTDQIDLLTTQLSTAQERISELASLSANSDDDLAYAEQRIELLSGYASTGAAVANALTRCLDGEEQLVAYLSSPDEYDEAEVAAFGASVAELCSAARASNSEFQRMLSE